MTFVADEGDAKVLNDVQERFEVNISELPDEIDISSYSKCHMGNKKTCVQQSTSKLSLCTKHLQLPVLIFEQEVTVALATDGSSVLRSHYENTPIQIYWKYYHQKMKIFR